jgi:VWFA-related protein
VTSSTGDDGKIERFRERSGNSDGRAVRPRANIFFHKNIWAICFLMVLLAGTAQSQSLRQHSSPANLAAQPPQAQAASPAPAPSEQEVMQEGSPQQNSSQNSPQPDSQQDSQDELLTLRRQVNFVEVPVTVKDGKSQLVSGLQKSDFQVYEEGELQPITFFTEDPLPMSIAILVDLGVPEIEINKVQETLTAMLGSFSPFDEVALYRFSNTVSRLKDFTTLGDLVDYPLEDTLKKLRGMKGAQGGVPVTSGPMQSGPTVSGAPIDPQSGAIRTVPATDGTIRERQPSRVLNDAILAAVGDLAKRPRGRRKIIFVLSDGAESGSQARDDEVLRALLSHPISVFGVGIGEAALPVYRQLGKARFSSSNLGHVLPSLGLGHALPRYAMATGGEVFPAYDQPAIERAYNKASEQARYRYTLGYHSHRPASGFHRIEVRVDRPGLQVLAREGYYPAPSVP